MKNIKTITTLTALYAEAIRRGEAQATVEGYRAFFKTLLEDLELIRHTDEHTLIDYMRAKLPASDCRRWSKEYEEWK